MRKQILALLITISVVTAFIFLNSTESENIDPTGNPATLSEEEFDYYMNNFVSTTFDHLGAKNYQVEAQRLTHFPIPDLSLLENPNFIIYQTQSPPWKVSANSARIYTDPGRDEQRIELIDNVVMYRQDESSQDLNIYTEFLTIYPESKTADSNREVLIVSPGARVNSTGMTVDLNASFIQLLQNVRGSYE